MISHVDAAQVQQVETGLTTRQAEVLAFIMRSIQETGAMPKRSEIAAAMGFISLAAVGNYFLLFERKGLLPHTPRMIIRRDVDPTLEEIAAMTSELRSTWTARDYRRRASGDPEQGTPTRQPWTPPRCTVRFGHYEQTQD